MKSTCIIASILVVLAACLGPSNAFVPNSAVSTTAFTRTTSSSSSIAPAVVMQGFLGDQEKNSLTREDEPEEFFKTYVGLVLSLVDVVIDILTVVSMRI